MAARVGDESFIPFVPRQLTRVSGSLGEREQISVPEKNGAQHGATTNGEPESMADCETTAEIENGAETQAQTKADAEASKIQATAVDVPTSRGRGNCCDHALEIRHEAIRLASIACGRALRHAVLLHPGVIAAFVDDAIAAAGLPQQVRIRVHPDSIASIRASHHDRIGDDDLSLGGVVIECNGVSVGAGIDTRAQLLVAAAAEA